MAFLRAGSRALRVGGPRSVRTHPSPTLHLHQLDFCARSRCRLAMQRRNRHSKHVCNCREPWSSCRGGGSSGASSLLTHVHVIADPTPSFPYSTPNRALLAAAKVHLPRSSCFAQQRFLRASCATKNSVRRRRKRCGLRTCAAGAPSSASLSLSYFLVLFLSLSLSRSLSYCLPARSLPPHIVSRPLAPTPTPTLMVPYPFARAGLCRSDVPSMGGGPNERAQILGRCV